MKQFVYGLLLGLASMYAWERVDPVGVFNYLNGATEYAVKSTKGYR